MSEQEQQEEVLAPVRLRLVKDKSDTRRDGTAIVIRAAYDLECAVHCFKLEADPQSLIDAEPHLRRLAQALDQLTQAAATPDT